MCGPHHRFAPLLSRTLRRIPQAVGTVATNYFGRHRPNWCHVSIPQAVSTVATPGNKTYLEKFCGVSIPQAVSTVATQTITHIF